MANPRALVRRRKAIRNIRKITRTMELIATARFKKAMDRAVEAEAYTRKIAELAADLSAAAGSISHPLLIKRPVVQNTLLLVLCSNRGLCGGYNSGILREANRRVREIQQTQEKLHLFLSGKRSVANFRFQAIQPEDSFTHFEDKPSYAEAEELANRFLGLYISGAVDRVEVAYSKFHNIARQEPTVETLLPFSGVPTVAPTRKAGQAEEPKGPAVEYEFLPEPAAILEELLPESFRVRLFKCFLDAAVSEQIARMVSMKSATENAGDMIKQLSLQYNRARQAQITKEIAEVIGGAESLK